MEFFFQRQQKQQQLIKPLSTIIGLNLAYACLLFKPLEAAATTTKMTMLQYHFENNNSTATTSSSSAYNWPILGLSLFSIFGIFGNLLVCMTISRDHTLQTKTNYYLYSLAIADLAVCLIVLPLSIIQDFSGRWIFNLLTCTIWVFLDILLCTVSIYHLSAVAILRFVAIQFPLKSKRTTSRHLTYLILFLIWTLSIFMSSSILYFSFVDSNNIMDATSKCYLRNYKFVLFGSIFSFVIPLLIMVVMFAFMVRKLRMQLSKQDNIPVPSSSDLVIVTNNNNNNQSKSSYSSRKQQHYHSATTNNNNSNTEAVTTELLDNNNDDENDENNNNNNNKRKKSNLSKRSIESESSSVVFMNRSKKLLSNAKSVPEYLTASNSTRNNNESNQLRRHARPSMHYFKTSLTSSSFSTPATTPFLTINNNSTTTTTTNNNNNQTNRPRLCKQLSQDLYSLQQHDGLRKLSNLSNTKSFEFKTAGNILSHAMVMAHMTEVQNEVKALQVLGIVFIAFIIAWLPYCLVNMAGAIGNIYEFSFVVDFHNRYLNYLTYLGYFSSTFNPIIYTVFNQKFRRNFLEILRCTVRSKRQKSTSFKSTSCTLNNNSNNNNNNNNNDNNNNNNNKQTKTFLTYY